MPRSRRRRHKGGRKRGVLPSSRRRHGDEGGVRQPQLLAHPDRRAALLHPALRRAVRPCPGAQPGGAAHAAAAAAQADLRGRRRGPRQL